MAVSKGNGFHTSRSAGSREILVRYSDHPRSDPEMYGFANLMVPVIFQIPYSWIPMFAPQTNKTIVDH